MNQILQPIIEVLNTCLIGLHGLTSDWGLAVILLTLLIRLIMFPFSLRTARQQVKQAHMQPALAEARKKFANDNTKLLQETAKVYEQYGVKPFSAMTAGLIQAPIFLGLYRLFATHGTLMSSHIVPWLHSLGQSDPLHIVPIVYGVFMLASMWIPLTSEMAVTGSMLSRTALPVFMAVIMSMVMWWAPAAVGLYGIAGSLFAAAERGFYRTPLGRRWLRIELPA